MSNKIIQIINGPNLNLLGTREPEIYGNRSFEDYLTELSNRFPTIDFRYYQSNIEGDLVNCIQQSQDADAIIANFAAYSHTSIAILDAIKMTSIPVIEVHISNVYTREDYRQVMLTASVSSGIIAGLGLTGYALAVEYCIQNIFSK